VALLEASRVPEQHQIVDDAGQGSSTGDRLGGLILGILEAEELPFDREMHSMVHLRA